MTSITQRLTRAALMAAALAFAGAALAQTAPHAPPTDFVAPAEPKPGESNAERSQSQPGNNAPFWRAVRESGHEPGVTNLPNKEGATLIQGFVQYPGSKFTSAGEAWRQVRNDWLIPYGGSLLLIALLAAVLHYTVMGPLKVHGEPTGRKIERFTPFERAAHWTNAIAFVVLAVSGIVMAFGKFILLPVFGATLFGWLAYVLKNAHNFAGPLFAVSLVIVFLTFVKDNFPGKGDLDWLKNGGGFIGKHVAAGRFNAGEKIVFWGGVFLCGLITVVSGFVLNDIVPGQTFTRSDMQIANMFHLASGALMMTLFAAHIYLGTVGTQGAYQAMRTGYVDEAWAKEHHDLWLQDVQAGRVPAQRSGGGAGSVSGLVVPAAK
jgi:formate dehydrogenase subunit gamma